MVDVFLVEAVQLDVVEHGVPALLHRRAGVLHVSVELVLTPRLLHRTRVSEKSQSVIFHNIYLL